MKCLLIFLLCAMMLSCASVPKPVEDNDTFRMDNLIPWSIVAFDSMERNPLERVRMIKDMGFSQYAFGGREKHVNTFPEEIQIAKDHNIDISAVWLYLNHEKDTPYNLRLQNEQVLSAIKEANITPQIWVGFHPKYFKDLSDEQAFYKGQKMISYLANRAADMGCTIGLYNHGGWMGNPDNQLKVLQAIDQENIGIVYNFHHGHEDIERYQELFPRLMPHLLSVNLNGMEKNGKKILTIGQGEYERAMIRELQTLGYNGPWGILGHVKGGDAQEILERNLSGLRNLDQPLEYLEKKKRVFLFAGQSNMDGRGNAADITDQDNLRLSKVQDRIELHYNHKESQPLQAVAAKAYIQRKFNLEHYFGPELFFGIHLAENNPQDSFLFIKRSQGGTSLYGCWNPYWTVEKATLMDEAKQPKLFSDFIAYTDEVLSDYDSSEYQIEGLLWVQGEDDSSKKRGPIPAEMYYDNLKNLLAETRNQLDAPYLPMYIFQVGNGKVVSGMQRLAEEDPNVYFIPQSKDPNSPHFYEKNPPPVGHYTTTSMKKIGEAFYKATLR